MTSQPLLDFEALVAPIPGENPAGVKDLSAIRSQLDELRKEINPETFAKNDPRRPEAAKKADWKGIIELAQETLRSTSKDYLIATRLTEALVKDRGFAGLTAGLRLLRQMTELCWDRMHPEITEEDDIDTRARRFDWLDDVDRGAWFPSSLRLVPMMPPGAEGYGWQHWKDSQGGKSKITGPDIEKAIQISSREACEDLVEDLSQSWQELELLSQVLNARMKTDTRNYAPGLMGIRGALVDCRTLAQQILQKKGGPKKGPELAAETKPDGVTGRQEGPQASSAPTLVIQVVMSAYYPKEVEPLVWHPLLAYIFRESVAFQVDADARERLGERIDEYRRPSKTARRPIAKGSTITAIPRLEGFQFNPPSQSVELHEDWHRLDFRLRGRPELARTASNGLLTFTVEGVIVADIPISIYVGDRVMTAEMVNAPGRPYRSIFCSYSRRDTYVVKHVERACKTLGIEYLRDVVSLRSGEPWQPALLSMIERADIFQLFWSRNAVRSKYVEDEWRYALRLGREPSRFIRPVYWIEPMPLPPPELKHLSFAFAPELASLLRQLVSQAYRLVARLMSRCPP